MDCSNNPQVFKLSTISLKPDFNVSQSNWKQPKAPSKLYHNNHCTSNSNTTKSKDSNVDWKNNINSTNTNWKNQSSVNWKNSTSSQWKNTPKNALKDGTKKKNSMAERSEEFLQNDMTLDQYLGQGYKALSLENINQSAFEGSEPPKMDEMELQYLDEDFEINETDEDMYSESATHSRLDMDSNQEKIRKVRTSKPFPDLSIDNDNAALLGDAKIKQKIIDKYSKNPKQKVQSQIQTILSVDKKIMDVKIDLNLCDQIRLPAASPNCKSQKTISPMENVKRTLCLSQSPLRSSEMNRIYFDNTTTNKALRGNNSKQQYYVKTYDDSKNVETHIGFRNSFYNNKMKQQDMISNQSHMKGKSVNIKSHQRQQQEDDTEKIPSTITLQKLNCYKEMVVKKEFITERTKHRTYFGQAQSNEV